MTRQELLQRSNTFLGRFAYEVKVQNSMGLFDINTLAEDFLIPIFAIAFNCPGLRNQNRIRMNFPAVDLGCETSRISIQITSDSSSSKVRETLEKFESHSLSSDFDSLYVYVITERQSSYSSQKLTEAVNKLPIKFDASTNILDYRDLAKKLGELTNKQLKHINEHLEEHFRQADANLQFRNNLDEFLRVSQQKIEDEKRTKKYIPSVFVETSETKEEMRYFANPMFFYRKIDDDLRFIDLNHLNQLLGMAKIGPIAGNLHVSASREKPNSLSELRERFVQQSEVLRVIQEHISPFSWYGERAERFEPSDYSTGYWKVLRFSIESAGSGVFSSFEEVSKKIGIAQAKIFLVTGMAGQGKTNFVCDLVENQFRAFEVPTIFIPARSLNDYTGPNRILSCIRNNRFAPDAPNFHDLLTLLNNVAEECQKPFLIVIDGINEVSDLDGFVAELRVFLEAMCQYDFIKIVITCRNEFFDHKFAGVFEPQFSDHLYRVQDLRREMSGNNKSRLLEAYLRYFKIKARLSNVATEFLKNDLILLRIFSEIHEGKNIGYVPDIYKGDIFEGYLTMKINEFPTSSRQKAIRSLYKICSRMLEEENFSQISVEGFDESEQQIIDQLIGEDIILRREVPSAGLALLGIENVSFTYDELRDFLLAYYTVVELSASHLLEVKNIFGKIPEWPIYEGFFRYAYVLARKQSSEKVLAICEASGDFRKHYLNNLSLLSADIQTTKDVDRLKSILKDEAAERDIRQVAWFLFRKREDSDFLNIRILLDHVNALDDEESERFFRAMFHGSYDFGNNNWRDRVSDLLRSLKDLTDEEILRLGVPTLALTLHFVTYARWDEREETLNFFAKFQLTQEIGDVIVACKNATSLKVQNCLKEIAEEREEP
ncbi:SMEK domain-containing protein [Prosthecochloris sp.]|uniref:SMEK domain-containing protein n=1 Tax=Prosthecochloris sp. TaxID=290513 RepID=UPI00257DD7D6|nr:SMEK domain-containing protein [Prosthecochloris sp.]